MKIQKTKAFTLVELIVVITILAILWTIAFIALQWYSAQSRDSVRISDIWSIKKMMEISLTNGWKVPKPENEINLTASWTLIWFQWELWERWLNSLNVYNGWKDPLDETYYTYNTNSNLTKYQITWFLENSENISYDEKLWNNANAIDYTNRYLYTKWNEIWIILNSTTGEPINKWWVNIDVVNTTNTYKVNFSSTDSVSGTWITLARLENIYKWVVQIVMDTCPTGWTDNWVITYYDSLGGGSPVSTPELRVCRNSWQIFNIWTTVAMTTCPTGWTDNWIITYYDSLGGGSPVSTPELRTCKNLWKQINSWDVIVMTTCPSGWTDNWVITYYDSIGWGSPVSTPELRTCKKN